MADVQRALRSVMGAFDEEETKTFIQHFNATICSQQKRGAESYPYLLVRSFPLVID